MSPTASQLLRLGAALPWAVAFASAATSLGRRTARRRARGAAQRDLAALIASANSVPDLAPRIIEALCAKFGWTCGVYWDWNYEQERFVRAGDWSVDDSGLMELDELLGRNAGAQHLPLLQHALRAGGLVTRDAAAQRDGAARVGARRRAACAVTITSGERVFGGLELYCRKGPALSHETSAVLRATTALIGEFYRRAKAERALRRSEQRLHGVMQAASEAILVLDQEDRIVLFNAAAERMFGYAAAETLGKSIERFIPPRLRQSHARHLKHFQVSGHSTRKAGQHRVVTALRRNGDEFPVEAAISRVRQEDGRWFYTVSLSDLTMRRRNEEQLAFLANYDALTALPNRSLFSQRLRRALHHAERFKKRLAVLFIDLDRFKNINDTLGHGAGDDALREIAKRLVRTVRESDTVARLGGDEFALLLDPTPEPHEVSNIAHGLLDVVAEPIALRGSECRLTASAGISAYPADAHDGQAMLKNAEIAMYRAKEQGRNNFQFYSARMNVHSVERLTLEADLRRAIEREQFVLHYQPKIDLRSGRITSVEALVRWRHPERGMIAPIQFIPIAEETGLITPIGEWVLRSACTRARAWQKEACVALGVAVNLSARQFARAHLAYEVARVLESSGLEPSQLELEITESMVMADPEQSVRTLHDLKAMGVGLSIDDFGTGYSSLAYLKRFPIDVIKVDRSFVQEIPGNSDDAALVKAIIAMARSLRLRVIAEGVESEEQCTFLREQGCDEIQGYYVSRPVPEDAVLALYRAQVEATVLTNVASAA